MRNLFQRQSENLLFRLYECLLFEKTPSGTIHNLEKDDPYLRIAERELLQSHRADPILCEGLLLAAECGSCTETPRAPTMECILLIF